MLVWFASLIMHMRISVQKIIQTPHHSRTFINNPFISQARLFSTKKQYSMANIELNCLIRGDTPAAKRTFPVKIARSRLVGSLKKQIIQEKPNRFKNTDADELTLWGVSIPLDDNADKLVFEDNEAKGIQELLPTQRLSTHFPEKLADDHVHIIVEPPIGE